MVFTELFCKRQPVAVVVVDSVKAELAEVSEQPAASRKRRRQGKALLDSPQKFEVQRVVCIAESVQEGHIPDWTEAKTITEYKQL